MTRLALHGGSKVIDLPHPHFRWPPPLEELPGVVAQYIEEGGPLSITDRGGVYGELEGRFCELHHRRFALAVSSGTMALYSAFFGLGIQQGDEVISTVYSFHATTAPLLHLGARVLFCDVEPDTGNIDTSHLEELISPRTKAVVTNDMWGHPVDKEAVQVFCRRHGLKWVEDCSHAHFAEYNGRFVGTFADAAVFSLQGNKLLTGGEGGIMLTNLEEVYQRATLLGHGLRRSEDCVQGTKWEPLGRTGFGLKLRMHPLAAVIVLHLLEHHCFDWIRTRAETLSHFSRGLEATGLVQPMARREYVTSMGAHYGFKPRIDYQQLGLPRKQIIEALQAEGVEITVPGSPPFHHLALFDPHRFPINHFEKADNRKRSFPGADQYYGSILSLPTFTFERDWPLVDQYIEAFNKVFQELEILR